MSGENVPDLWAKIEEHRAHLEQEGQLEERRRKNLAGEVFAAMTPEDALLVRAALGGGERLDDEDDVEDEESGEDPEDADAAGEEEIARLQAEIESSRRSQAALERYLELLDR